MRGRRPRPHPRRPGRERPALLAARERRCELVAASRRVDVLDHGPGLAPGEEDDVFERFHRGSAGRAGPSGTGLGLPIARELAAEWAAAVALSNRPDGGAHASVRFRGGAVAPCAAAGAVPAAHEAPAAGPGRRRTRGRGAAAVAVLATAGIALAAVVSVATGTLTSQRIGLAAEPISAGAGLAPTPEDTAHAAPHRTHRRPRRSATVTATTPPSATMTAPPPTPAPPRTVTTPPAPAPSGGGDDGAGADD